MSSVFKQPGPISLKGQNHKAQLANAYNELGKELSSTKIKVVGNYTLGKVIGEGAYGKVRLGTHRLTSTRVAVKQIPKAVSASLTREIHHHRQLHHPHVTQMYEVIATETSIWIVTELCSGGELFDYLVEKGRLTEDESRLLFGQLCLAVAYLHDKGIVHRDLKLENILLDERCRIKLGDFGFTREFERGKFMETFCGTTGYAAPEMLQGNKYRGPEVDIWSLGVILYCLLTGTLPFDDDDETIMRDKIIQGNFEDPEWLSAESRDLIKKILQKDPLKRLTIQQILSHAWFTTRLSSPLHELSVPLPPEPGSNPSTSIDIDPSSGREITSDPTSRLSDASITLASTEFDSASTTLEGTSSSSHNYDPLQTSNSNSVGPAVSVLLAPSEPTLTPTETGTETYEQFSTRMAPHLALPSDHPPEAMDSNAHSSSSLSSSSVPRPLSLPGSKPHPPAVVRTPVRTKRRSVSSVLSEHGSLSPTADQHNTSTTTQYPDFASLLNTPAPIIFSTPLERDLLTSLSNLGFDTAQIVHSVLSDACDSAGTLWWMLKRKAEKTAFTEAAEKEIRDATIGVASSTGSGHSMSSLKTVDGQSKSKEKHAVRASSSVSKASASVQTDEVSLETQTLSATRSAPQLAFVPPTPTFSSPETPPQPRSPTQMHLSPTLTPSGSSSSRSHPSTPSGSFRDKDRPKDRDKGESMWSKGKTREGKVRSGSVSIMQRATTALEAAGLVKKRSAEVVREEKEKAKESERDRRLASGEEPRSSYGSASSKISKSTQGHGKNSNAGAANTTIVSATTATVSPSTPPSETSHPTQMGSPWVVTEAQQSPPNVGPHGAPPTPANSPRSDLTSDPFISPTPSSSGNNILAKSMRHRASFLTNFRLWFNDDRKGKRKDSNLARSTSSGGGVGILRGGSLQGNRMNGGVSGNSAGGGGSGGTAKRRTGGSASGSMSSRRVGHRAHRHSVSSRRSSSANSRRSSAASAQIILLEPPLVIDQIPARRSIGSHTPNSERGDFSTSRPASLRSLSGQGPEPGQVQPHRKSPSASSASSMHFRTTSPMQKYHHSNNHKRVGSGSSTKVVRQVHPAHHHHPLRHGRSNSASSSLHSPTSSRPTSFYENPIEADVPFPRTSSPFRPPGGRRSLDETKSTLSNTSTPTTFIAQKRQTPFMAPSGNTLGRSSWKKSWGLEPPGWQSRTTQHLPIEVLAVSPASGTGTNGDGGIRDVFSGKGLLNLGDESDWVDEDDELPTFAGGLGQTATLQLTVSGSNTSSSVNPNSNTGSGSHAQLVPESPSIQFSPPNVRRGTKRAGKGRNTNVGSGSGSSGGGAMTARRKPGHSPIERPLPISIESNYETSELRGTRRQLPSGRSGPAFRHAIQEEDEGEEE